MEDQELIARYRAGETLKAIAEAAGCRLQTIATRVSKLRETHSLPYRRTPLSVSHPRRKLAAARKELALQLNAQGVPIKEIAERAGIGEMAVRQIIAGTERKNYESEIARVQAELATITSTPRTEEHTNVA